MHSPIKNISLRILLLVIALFLILPIKAYCYLDPGTASMIIQAILAMFFGALLALKLYWQKLKAFFTKSASQDKEHESSERD